MARSATTADRLAAADHDIRLTADILIIGGSLAGSWAGIAAAQAGARVVLVDKGYAGASGPIASGSVGAYFIKPDDPVQRDVMVNARMPLAFGLADSRWGEKILDQVYTNLELMAQWGYKWPRTQSGKEERGHITPNVLAFLRQRLEKLNVHILDHHPALELLVSDGVAAGATGINRRTGETWAVRAGAVIVATGGTAFLSKLAGTGGNTGDGYLIAAEAGAEFSGMEFSSQYHIKPYGCALSKGVYRGNWSTLRDGSGKVVQLGRQTANAMLETGEVWDLFDKESDPVIQKQILETHYTTAQYFGDLGIDPFKERHRADWVLEGTIRATGGLVIDDDLSTTVPGLFASGDVTSREKLNGAGPPGGGPASSWAIGAGTFAGQAAAAFAKRFGNSIASRKVAPVGGIGLRPTNSLKDDIPLKAVIDSVQEEMLPLDRNYYRTGPNLEQSLVKFDALWKELRERLAPANDADPRASARAALRTREAASLLAAARWVNISALERKESRGIHRRADFPTLDPAQTHHVISGGLDSLWVKTRPVDPTAIVKQVTLA